MRASLSLVMLIAVGTARAQPAPTPSPSDDGAWARACSDTLTAAATTAGRHHRLFRKVAADSMPPIDLPSRWSPGRRSMPLPPVHRAAWSAHWNTQDNARAEYFYLDVIDVRDDRNGWAAQAGDEQWACVGSGPDGSDPGFTCVQRRGDRLAIVRAIGWRRSARIAAYRAAMLPAAEACLR